jgi:dynein heavy chain
MEEAKLMTKPNIFCHFALGTGGDPKYMPIQDWEQLHGLLTDALKDFNEMNAQMNLVLFEDAMLHVCR